MAPIYIIVSTLNKLFHHTHLNAQALRYTQFCLPSLLEKLVLQGLYIPYRGKRPWLSPQRGRKAIPGNPLSSHFPQYRRHSRHDKVLVVTALWSESAGRWTSQAKWRIFHGNSVWWGGDRMALVAEPGENSWGASLASWKRWPGWWSRQKDVEMAVHECPTGSLRIWQVHQKAGPEKERKEIVWIQLGWTYPEFWNQEI